MTPAQQQRKALAKRAKRYARRCGWDFASIGYNTTVAAYEAGFKAGNVATIKAPAAALLHVLDTQAVLKAKVAELREALRNASGTLTEQAYALMRAAGK